MAGDFATLAPIYEMVGMAAFAEAMTPRLVLYAQSNDWIGRRVVDLGCGTGAAARWLAQHGYTTIAVDESAEMLQIGRQGINSTGLSLVWVRADARALPKQMTEIDLVLAFDVVNDLAKLSDVEAMFASVFRALEPGKWFAFDLHTHEGLAERGGIAAELAYESETLTMFTTHQFDHERQSVSERHLIFRREENGWRHTIANRLLRAYAVQGIAALLVRIGFTLQAALTPTFEQFDLTTPRGARVIFVARKPGGEA